MQMRLVRQHIAPNEGIIERDVHTLKAFGGTDPKPAAIVCLRIWPVFEASPPTWAIAAAMAVSLGVGIVFGMLPAWRATRLDPVLALGRR